MDEAYELYRRTRNEKVDRTSKIEAWFEEQKELNAKASLPGKSSIHGGLSDTGSRRSENADRDLGDGIKSENEGEMESEEFDDDSGDSLVDMDREVRERKKQAMKGTKWSLGSQHSLLTRENVR